MRRRGDHRETEADTGTLGLVMSGVEGEPARGLLAR
jgi:hypothetical protein